MDGGEADVDVVEVLLEHVGAQGVGQRRAHRFGEVAADVVDRVVGGDGQQSGSRLLGFLPDRKSTRLNSSHVAISYAVFCLKKKTQTNAENMWQKRHHEAT